MSDDLRTRIAWILYRETQQQDAYVEDIEQYPGEPAIDTDTVVDGQIVFTDLADAVIRELPELQPCPFCGLSHNRCDCLRTTDERT